MQVKNKILAVDDNLINLAAIEELFGSQYDLKTVSRGLDVLKTAQEFRPDLIILDIMLPDIDGYEVCRRIRNDSVLRYTKIVMVSAKAMASERLRGYQAGADDYLTKPYDGEELLAKVCAHLRPGADKAIQQNEQNPLNTLYGKINALLDSLANLLSELTETLESDENVSTDKRRRLVKQLNGCVKELQNLGEQTGHSGSSDNRQVKAYAGEYT
jgi:DNA-binding response OmpR family regulator